MQNRPLGTLMNLKIAMTAGYLVVASLAPAARALGPDDVYRHRDGTPYDMTGGRKR